MRVVLDTNVLLSGFLTRGLCESMLDACFESHTVYVSEHILAEFAAHAEGKFGVPHEQVAWAIAAIRRRTVVVEPAVIPVDACGDADDLPVLGTAVASRADVLATGDGGLLRLGQIQGIPILAPRQLLERLC